MFLIARERAPAQRSILNMLEILGKILENTAKGESDKQPMAGLRIQNLLCAISIAVAYLSVLQF